MTLFKALSDCGLSRIGDPPSSGEHDEDGSENDAFASPKRIFRNAGDALMKLVSRLSNKTQASSQPTLSTSSRSAAEITHISRSVATQVTSTEHPGIVHFTDVAWRPQRPTSDVHHNPILSAATRPGRFGLLIRRSQVPNDPWQLLRRHLRLDAKQKQG